MKRIKPLSRSAMSCKFSLIPIALIGANIFPIGGAKAGTYAVKVTDYGAVCDGSTNDATALQSAVNSVTANMTNTSGGEILFPSGVCVINGTVNLQDVALVGAEVPHFSDAGSGPAAVEAGTVLSIGTATIAPSSTNPTFRITHSVTFRGLNIIYPYQIAKGLVSGSPVPAGPTITDNGTEVSNVVFDNVHVIGAYDFWTQSGTAPVYGNVKFNNSDIYAIRFVFSWSNVQETVTLNNVIFNPSLCGGGPVACSSALKNWTADNGVWFHVIGGVDYANRNTAVEGIIASNTTVIGYKVGVLIDSNGHLDESLFGPTTVFETPYVLSVNSNGSISATVFSGKTEFSGKTASGTAYSNAAFTLSNPQFPLPNDPLKDHNSLFLSGFTAGGIAGPLLAAAVTTGDIGVIQISGVSVRNYCDGATTSDAVDISAPYNATQSTAVIITGSQITTSRSGCGGVVTVTNGAPLINANNLIGYYPLN